jgi:hypothetical protein
LYKLLNPARFERCAKGFTGRVSKRLSEDETYAGAGCKKVAQVLACADEAICSGGTFDEGVRVNRKVDNGCERKKN